jgi:hypothetical protein
MAGNLMTQQNLTELTCHLDGCGRKLKSNNRHRRVNKKVDTDFCLYHQYACTVCGRRGMKPQCTMHNPQTHHGKIYIKHQRKLAQSTVPSSQHISQPLQSSSQSQHISTSASLHSSSQLPPMANMIYEYEEITLEMPRHTDPPHPDMNASIL